LIAQSPSLRTQVEHFWRIYDYLKRPKDLHYTEYHLFKEGIFPTWEDPQNKAGGKWMIRLKKGIASRYWEDIILAIIGEQFDVGSEVCGAVLSVRNNEDIVSIWNKTADNLEAVNKIRDQLRRLLRLPAVIAIEYKRHQDSLVDKSSYRNPTMVWRATNRQANPDKPHGFSNYNAHSGSANTAAAPGAYPNKAWKPRNNNEEGAAPQGAGAGGFRSQQQGNPWNKPAEANRNASGDAPSANRGRTDSQEGAGNPRVGGGWQRGQGLAAATSPTAGSAAASAPAAAPVNNSATAALHASLGINKTKAAVAPPVPTAAAAAAAAPAVGNAWARKGPTI
jgi:translation initiation factor 4E